MCSGNEIGLTKVGKSRKIMAIVDENSSPHELRLLADVLSDLPNDIKPNRLAGDRVYDSDEHDTQSTNKSIELIAAHRKGRLRPKTQDGRKLKRLKK